MRTHYAIGPPSWQFLFQLPAGLLPCSPGAVAGSCSSRRGVFACQAPYRVNNPHVSVSIKNRSINMAEREAFVAAHHKLCDQAFHIQLQKDLIEHNWMRYCST
ncbi:hypothetical protein EJB05_50519 [Eragrostis curvula]|uniref:Uncharacterized protein n=1 Tax=Eragrostis curvula TaxID=38414 RepID=A0A5J9SXZ5_9POAL|nr:hypothetical protein EJB05_50519 [Eragrostis curvula]